MKTKLRSFITFTFILVGIVCFSACDLISIISPINTNSKKIVYDMQFGWNLGNTLDAHYGEKNNNIGLSTETCWGQPETTQAMIKGLAKSGIKTIRIPVSWHNHVLDNNYTIDSAWMARVKEIVNWAIAEDMYVILNIHHDNSKTYGFFPSSEYKTESLKYLTGIWKQIADNFNNAYDEHLVFEMMNEPRLVDDEHEWDFQSSCETCIDCMNCVNEFNQECLDVIRSSGGNNAKRLVMFPAIAASPDSAFNELFKIPEDSAEEALALSVHMYTPYPFAMGVDINSNSDFTELDKSILDYYFSTLNEKFVSKGIPVVIGEMGATNKDNLKDREEWFEYFVKQSRKYGIASCLWDNGNPEPSTTESERYGYYDRENAQWYFPSLIEIAVEAAKTE